MRTIRIGKQDLAVGNIFCVAGNYLDHAKEMGSQIGADPTFFIKPTSALLPHGADLVLPAWSRDVHHEVELVVAIGRDAENISPAEALAYVAGYAVGLDLTARDVQAEAKKAGRPWTLSKGFRGAAVLSSFVPAAAIPYPGDVAFSLTVNGEVRQVGHTAHLAFDVPHLIAWLSGRFGLQAGDLIYTGTPAGVGPLQSGDALRLQLGGLVDESLRVA